MSPARVARFHALIQVPLYPTSAGESSDVSSANTSWRIPHLRYDILASLSNSVALSRIPPCHRSLGSVAKLRFEVIQTRGCYGGTTVVVDIITGLSTRISHLDSLSPLGVRIKVREP